MSLVTLAANRCHYCEAKIMISLWICFSCDIEKYNIADINDALCACVNKVTWWISKGTKTNTVWVGNERKIC